jgi:hypothetical protein
MFKSLFLYWYNPTDTSNLMFKVNIWAYINILLFKLKIQNFIFFYILNNNGLAFKQLKILIKNWSFETLYFRLVYILVLFFFIFIIA